MRNLPRVTRNHAIACCVLWFCAGCGPRPPSVLLDSPAGLPDNVAGRKLFHTPSAYIYARSDLSAGEVDRMVQDVASYVKRSHKCELGKGLVVVMDPQDTPIAGSLEDQIMLERDPSILLTKPRHPKGVEDVRKRMVEEGIPERPMVRGASLPLPKGKLRDIGLSEISVPWAIAIPSHELAMECGVDVGIAALRKKRPDISEEQARKVAGAVSNSLAKAFEVVRPIPLFVYWVQMQPDWQDDQRREAILDFIKHVYRSNWVPVPSDDELQW